MKLIVEGMSCGHCVRSVTKAIHAHDPGARVTVDLAHGIVRIDGTIGVAAACEAISAEGYTITSVEPTD